MTAAPAWNSLPDSVTAAFSVTAVKRQLKTFLVSKSYCHYVLCPRTNEKRKSSVNVHAVGLSLACSYIIRLCLYSRQRVYGASVFVALAILATFGEVFYNFDDVTKYHSIPVSRYFCLRQ